LKERIAAGAADPPNKGAHAAATPKAVSLGKWNNITSMNTCQSVRPILAMFRAVTHPDPDAPVLKRLFIWEFDIPLFAMFVLRL
jgi:hypothetical protein